MSTQRLTAVAGATAVLAAVLSLAGSPPSAVLGQEGQGRSLGETQPQVVAKTVPQRQWEYKQIYPCVASKAATGEPEVLTQSLNEQGRVGWELVSLIQVPEGSGRGGVCYLATFKRGQLH